MPLTLADVNSFFYIITSSAQPVTWQALKDTPQDLVIIGSLAEDPPLDRSQVDPNHTKLLFSYLVLVEASSGSNPSLFTGGTLPSWFGKENPDWPGIYSVRYWDPAWRTDLLARIDRSIAEGWDGIFLDVASAAEWAPGNPTGNPVYADRDQALADLLKAIHDHVQDMHVGHPYYIIANNPTGVAEATPNALKYLDGILNESVLFRTFNTGNNVSTIETAPLGESYFNYIVDHIAPIYADQGMIVLGNDYPNITDASQLMRVFETYSELGWVPSAVQANDTLATARGGPYMFMATPSQTAVTGGRTIVNYLAGGQTASATLTGGDRDDYFIGGPGVNVISGGGGNDVIYAHPSDAGLKNVLQVSVSTSGINATQTPAVDIVVNGQIVRTVPVTDNVYDNNFRQLVADVDLSPYGAISEIKLVGRDIYFRSANDFNNITIDRVKLSGELVDLAGATVGPSTLYFAPNQSVVMNAGGSIMIASAQLPTSPYLANTSDQIDGGDGVNAVIYRGASAQYRLAAATDGAVVVTALATSEGPDTLRHIQTLTFTDKTVALPDAILLAASLSVLRQQPFDGPWTLISGLEAQVRDGALTEAAAVQQIVRAASDSSSVATLAYQFFTGHVPSAGGMDYLISPTGQNPNNLNSLYYQKFSLENRYINFAVNLGKVGEGNAAFTAKYGGLTLFEATRAAYATIFGEAPSDAKLHAILDPTTVLNGVTFTRSDYFAYYGQDGTNGIGAKAAMVGYLLAEAEKADVGVYAKSNDAFLMDVALHNAPFAVDLVGVYNQPGFVFHPG